ncbi:MULTISPECIES: maleylpyruvate isomerase family mycothiol-dependent enzyme [Thermomonosporaceae]|uniref:maleylpyruvate isomerase family mycothiol-dependent enzyme n=1 Tax=Thermomonosporaceae TaxID=2012 RepID=UPI00255A93A8|nr:MULTISPECIES: maleylpyruvate isomerase family mycothiol-dependent enzyme [Thermomonosporaceae]MDL4774475.1 maleylpyruvate isomerase family mycothiol-dependent enzyme [Actinomadura xylanilytica]
MELWDAVAGERRALADLLEALTPEQLATRSLCEAWTVRDVAAHLVAALDVSLPSFTWTVVTCGGDMHKASRRVTAQIAARPIDDLAATLRRRAGYRAPLRRPEGPLADLLIHSQDIRRPLGLSRRFAKEDITAVLRFLTEQRTVGFAVKGAVGGLAWAAADLDWSYGSGPAVRGPAEALMMVITGRTVALADLEGEGVPVLRDRLS